MMVRRPLRLSLQCKNKANPFRVPSRNLTGLLFKQTISSPIELKKGMFAIQCDTIEEAGQALAAVRAMVLNGELDE